MSEDELELAQENDAQRAQRVAAVSKPGVHTNVPMGDYLRIPALSAGVIRSTVDRCPAAGWYESWLNTARVDEADEPGANEAELKRKGLGSIGHSILLEGSEATVTVLDPNDFKGIRGGIPKGFTNDAIKAARDEARKAGKVPVLKDDMAEIRNMVASGRKFIDRLKAKQPDVWRAFQPDGGASEVTVVWDDDGQLCRMRADRMSTDGAVIVDPKFTLRSASPGPWGRTQLYGMGYYISAAWYARGVRTLFDVATRYYFLVIETVPPYLVSLVGVDPAWMDLGRSKVETGLALWKQCAASGDFPAYPDRACYPDLPGWAAAQWEAEQASDAFGIPYDPAKLFTKSAP